MRHYPSNTPQEITDIMTEYGQLAPWVRPDVSREPVQVPLPAYDTPADYHDADKARHRERRERDKRHVRRVFNMLGSGAMTLAMLAWCTL